MAPRPDASILDEDEACALLDTHGCLVVTSVCPKDVCVSAREYVDARLLDALAQCGQTSTSEFPKGAGQYDDPNHVDAAQHHFGDVLAPPHRRDLKLPLDAPVRNCLNPALVVLTPILGNDLTPDAELCELSCLISDPGASKQRFHPDTPIAEQGFGKHCALITVFVALQDVSNDMGPTEVLEGTHCSAAHDALNASVEDDEEKKLHSLRSAGFPEHSKVTLHTGDALVMDSRLIHRGGGNVSSLRRALLYTSFSVPNNKPCGSTYSLLEELVGRKIRLSKLETWCSVDEKE